MTFCPVSQGPCTCLSPPLGGSDILLAGPCPHQHAAEAQSAPLSVPTATRVAAYSAEFINLFAAPGAGARQPLEITRRHFKLFSAGAADSETRGQDLICSYLKNVISHQSVCYSAMQGVLTGVMRAIMG